jgi:hypothetical protein
MAKARNWAYTDFSDDDALTLNIEGIGDFKVSQFTCTYSINEIPRATCMVAIGRDARSFFATQYAQIHSKAEGLHQLRKATVKFKPSKEWSPPAGGGVADEWKGEKLVFEGYFTGMATRKISGKTQIILHLVHWLVDLTFSSTLTEVSHPGSPMSLLTPAAFPGDSGGGGTSQPIYVSNHIGKSDIRDKVKTDLWDAIKSFLCGIASRADLVEFTHTGNECAGSGQDLKKNDQALAALKRIYGPGRDCDLPYGPVSHYVKPLKMETDGVQEVDDAVAVSINHKTFADLANSTFWEAMLGMFGEFSLGISPLVDKAVVFADCPGIRETYEKEIKPEEVSAIDYQSSLNKPIRGVAVFGGWESSAKIEVTEKAGGSAQVIIGGCYTEDIPSGSPTGGVLYVQSPSWLKNVTADNLYGKTSQGVSSSKPTPTTTTPASRPPPPTKKKPSDLLKAMDSLYKRYAHSVFINSQLRGRTATLSGKLRFDIAPGSNVKVGRLAEQFARGFVGTLLGLGSEAADLVGQVGRVTININSEAKLAGTTFQLTNVRTVKENTESRTSTDVHPLFGKDIFIGCPLHLPDEDWLFP